MDSFLKNLGIAFFGTAFVCGRQYRTLELLLTLIINRSCHDDLQQSRRPCPAHHHHCHLLPRRHHELRRQGCSSLSSLIVAIANWPIVRSHNSKGANKSGAAELLPILYRKGRKGANLLKSLFYSS
jgi:hypothetical protein